MNFDTNEQQNHDETQNQEQATVENSVLQECQEQVNLWKNQAARVLADFDNYKKRMDKEQSLWISTAQVGVLKDLLTMLDNFERALANKSENAKDVYAGIEMIYKSFVQVLQKYGVQEFTDYQEFNPELHEALMTVDSADHQSGQIVQVLEKGFMAKDKVLRPAKVSIAK
ncbi:MAG: nucleotide exchange factor GrpE [Candidatus Chromulinivorax sp.]